jgi:hypothetical protein
MILVLPPRYTEDSIALWEAAGRLGWKTERLPGWRPPEWLVEERGDVAVYGEPLFAATVADQIAISLLEPPLDWVARIPTDYTKRSIEFTDLASARTVAEKRFFKPADDKAFVAGVYESGAELPDHVESQVAVLTSDVVEWEVEFRAFMLNGEPLAVSPYWRSGQLAKNESGGWPFEGAERDDALRFAAEVLADERVTAPPAVALDVGLIKGKGWGVVEANPCFGSGIYGCDPEQVLRVVARASVRWPSEVDVPWIRETPE